MKSIVVLLSLVCALATAANAACRGTEPRGVQSRYVVAGAEIFDKKTGLTWQRCRLGMTWTSRRGCDGEKKFLTLAEAADAALQVGGGWRVPTVDELYGLLDKSCGTPAIDTKLFPDVGADEEDNAYWTTSKVGMGNLVYYVDFVNGDADGHSPGFRLAVRLVKTGK
jgi:hypothetical protein